MTHIAFDSPALSRSANLEFTGARCKLRTNDPALIKIFSPWSSAHRRNSHDFVLRIEVKSDGKDEADGESHFRGLQHLVVAQFGASNLFVFNLLTREVQGVVSKQFAYDGSRWHHVIVPLILGVMGATIGLLPLHSACVVRGGNGLLIAGASGAGKSTMAVALAKAGFELLSDDWTYIARRDSSLKAHGLALPVKLLPNSIDFFPELSSCAAHLSLNGEMAFEVSAQETFHVPVVATCIPRWFMFLERTARGSSEIVPIEQSFSRDYIEHSTERLPKEVPRAITLRQQTINYLAELPCWSFRHAGSPQAGARLLYEFVQRQQDAVTA